MKRWFTKLALWILGGQFVSVEAWEQAHQEREDVLRAVEQYDRCMQRLKQLSSNYSELAARIDEFLTNYTENVQSPQMIDIRVPRKVLK